MSAKLVVKFQTGILGSKYILLFNYCYHLVNVISYDYNKQHPLQSPMIFVKNKILKKLHVEK